MKKKNTRFLSNLTIRLTIKFYLCKSIISLNFQSNNYFHLSKPIAELGLDDELNITNLVIIELHIGHIISEARFSCVLSCVSPFYKLFSIYIHLKIFPGNIMKGFLIFFAVIGVLGKYYIY